MTLFVVRRLCFHPVHKKYEQDGRETLSQPSWPLESRAEALVSIRGLLVRLIPAKMAGTPGKHAVCLNGAMDAAALTGDGICATLISRN